MTGGSRRAFVPGHIASLGLALWLALAVSVSLAYSPRMQHADDCPMPEHSRGASSVLNVPAVPPPVTLGPASYHDLELVLFWGSSEPPDAPATAAPHARDPPTVRASY